MQRRNSIGKARFGPAGFLLGSLAALLALGCASESTYGKSGSDQSAKTDTVQGGTACCAQCCPSQQGAAGSQPDQGMGGSADTAFMDTSYSDTAGMPERIPGGTVPDTLQAPDLGPAREDTGTGGTDMLPGDTLYRDTAAPFDTLGMPEELNPDPGNRPGGAPIY